MYKDFYQMEMEAFGSLPLLKIFFNSKTHKNAWHYLLYGISSKEQFLLLTGDFGMGKTMLCLGLVKKLAEVDHLPFVYISAPNYGYTHILTEIADTLGIAIDHKQNLDLQTAIYDHFRREEEPHNLTIIIDDAQELDPVTLGRLRALADFNHNGRFPFRIIFFAHNSFLEMLQNPPLIPLGQRIKRRNHLENFDFNEVKEYIFSRLVKSGAPGIPTFTQEALEAINDFSNGVPRLINNVCDACLLYGASHRLMEITSGVVAEAAKSLAGYQPPEAAASEHAATAAPEPAAAEPTPPPQPQYVPPQPPEALQPQQAAPHPPPPGFDDYPEPAVYATPQAATAPPVAEARPGLAPDPWQESAAFDADADQPMRLTLDKGEPQKKAPKRKTVSLKGQRLLRLAGIVAIVILLLGLIGYGVWYVWNWALDRQSSAANDRPAISEESSNMAAIQPTKAPKKESGLSKAGKRVQDLLAGKVSPKQTTGTKGESGIQPASFAKIKTYRQELSEGVLLEPQADDRIRWQPISSGSSSDRSSRPYTIHLSSYKTIAKAKASLRNYFKKGLEPYLVKVDLKNKGIWYRIYHGHFSSQAEANRHKSRLTIPDTTVLKTAYANYLGRFASTDTLQPMVSRLREGGHFPYTLRGPQSSFELYAGAFVNRSEAEAQRRSLDSVGIKSQVVMQ